MKIANGNKERCIKALIKAARMLGSENALAKITGESRQRVNYWKQTETFPPFHIAAKISMATRGRVSAYDIRPDLEPFIREFVEFILERGGDI